MPPITLPELSPGSSCVNTAWTLTATWNVWWDGSIDAAYVGSTLSPEQVAQEEGFHLLAWVGDHFQIPTVGVAVDPVHIPLDSPVLQALVRANQRALR
jgi:hypothetical protein